MTAELYRATHPRHQGRGGGPPRGAARHHRGGRPMTVRQVFYQATVRGLVEKAESGYGKVQADLTVMRRARELPYDWLADNTRWQRKPRTFDSVEDALRNTAAFYRKALWNEADSYVEIWLEKDALAGVVYPATSMYDVPLMVARGYASLSFLYSAAEAINELDVPAYIYLPMIGFLNGGSSWEYAQMAATFRKGFGETGLLIVVLALVKPLSPPGDLSGQLICGPIEA